MRIWHNFMLPTNRTVQTCIQMDMEKIIIRCSADYLQYEFPKRKWYQLRQYNRIALMRLTFGNEDILESDIVLEVYENYAGDPMWIVEDSYRDSLYEAMLMQYRRYYKDAQHLIVADNGEDLSEFLYEIADNCNYLSVMTNNPEYYEDVAQHLEEEYGLVAMFFLLKKELLRYIKQMPEERKVLLILGRADEEQGKIPKHGILDNRMTSIICCLPKDSLFMDFSENGICKDLIHKKRLKINYVSIPIFLDNTVKNRYNAVVNEGITFQVKKDKKQVWRRKGNEDGRKEKYPDLRRTQKV